MEQVIVNPGLRCKTHGVTRDISRGLVTSDHGDPGERDVTVTRLH